MNNFSKIKIDFLLLKFWNILSNFFKFNKYLFHIFLFFISTKILTNCSYLKSSNSFDKDT